MPIITEALKIYWGQKTECEDNDHKLFSRSKGTEVSKGYGPGERRCPGELTDLLLLSSRMAHLNQQIKQRRQKTCLDEQGTSNLMKRKEGSIES